MTIAVGDRLPEATFLEKEGDEITPVTVADLFTGRRVVLFGLPGAFTGMCSTQHLPSFIRVADALRAKGVDEIVCVAVNDPHVMLAWGESSGAKAAGIRMMADVQAEFAAGAGPFVRQSAAWPFLALAAVFAAGRGRGGAGAEPRDQPHRLRDQRGRDDAGGGLRAARG